MPFGSQRVIQLTNTVQKSQMLSSESRANFLWASTIWCSAYETWAWSNRAQGSNNSLWPFTRAHAAFYRTEWEDHRGPPECLRTCRQSPNRECDMRRSGGDHRGTACWDGAVPAQPPTNRITRTKGRISIVRYYTLRNCLFDCRCHVMNEDEHTAGVKIISIFPSWRPTHH